METEIYYMQSIEKKKKKTKQRAFIVRSQRYSLGREKQTLE